MTTVVHVVSDVSGHTMKIMTATVPPSDVPKVKVKLVGFFQFLRNNFLRKLMERRGN